MGVAVSRATCLGAPAKSSVTVRRNPRAAGPVQTEIAGGLRERYRGVRGHMIVWLLRLGVERSSDDR
jgi:hypothetical protein